MIRTGDDYRDVTYEYLAGCAREGALYVELTASPDHAALVGLSDEEHLDGIARGIDDARRDFGIEGRILISCVRNFGVEQALRVARYAAARPHPYVVGFSMAGDEENFPAGDYVEAVRDRRRARGSAAPCTPGSGPGADSVRAGIGLPVTRIGHGVRAIEDPELVEELAERGIVLECCPTSNVVLGAFDSYEDHPLPRLRAGRREGHARLGRPALLRGVDRRRVRRLPRAHGLRRRRAARDHTDRSRGRILRGNAQEWLNSPGRWEGVGCPASVHRRGRSLVSKRFRLFALALVAALALGIAACGSDDSTTAATAEAAAASQSGEQIKAGLVTDIGGLNDRSFNFLANKGRLDAQKKLGIDTRVLLSKSNGDYVPNLSTLAQQKYQSITAGRLPDGRRASTRSPASSPTRASRSSTSRPPP